MRRLAHEETKGVAHNVIHDQKDSPKTCRLRFPTTSERTTGQPGRNCHGTGAADRIVQRKPRKDSRIPLT